MSHIWADLGHFGIILGHLEVNLKHIWDTLSSIWVNLEPSKPKLLGTLFFICFPLFLQVRTVVQWAQVGLDKTQVGLDRT